MAVINVNPTRMELTNLKRKLVTARRGHKLLKDKRDELMRQFLELVKENKRLREKVEKAVSQANRHFSMATASMNEESLAVSLMMPSQRMSLDVKEKNIMSVKTPAFVPEYKFADKGEVYSYGLAFTSGDLDDGVKILSEIMPDMLRLAEVEKTCQLLSSEIEKTRRRVNALEYVMIPDYEDTIKFITMKLDENDRSNTTRLMKIKDMMLQQSQSI